MDLTSRKRTACERCRKLKVACRKPDLPDDVCERCLRSGFVCVTESYATLQDSGPAPSQSLDSASCQRQQLVSAAPVSDIIPGSYYFADSQGSQSAGSSLSEFISAISGAQTDVSDSGQSAYTPRFASTLRLENDRANSFLGASHEVCLDFQSLSANLELEKHAGQVLWDISRQLARFRDSSWDPRTVRLAWLDVDFDMRNPSLSPPESLVAITLRYTSEHF
jgi:hypothetical protein